MLEWYQFTYVLTVGFTASIIGTYLTESTDAKVLEQFYVKTRPFGMWGPFKNSLDEKTKQDTRKEHINDIIAIPFGICWIISMLLLPLQLMIMKWVAFAITFIVFVVSLVGLYIFWYRHLPLPAPKEEKDKEKPKPVDELISKSC
jgi:Flp pilus assembly protein TadB